MFVPFNPLWVLEFEGEAIEHKRATQCVLPLSHALGLSAYPSWHLRLYFLALARVYIGRCACLSWPLRLFVLAVAPTLLGRCACLSWPLRLSFLALRLYFLAVAPALLGRCACISWPVCLFVLAVAPLPVDIKASLCKSFCV
jgi:hypothetical protein